jgi:hypothetical protein
MAGTGAFFGLSTGLYFAFGNRLGSFKEETDEFERKEIVRRTKRVPIEQTIAEIGEGRGKTTIHTMLLETPQAAIAPRYKLTIWDRHQAPWL